MAVMKAVRKCGRGCGCCCTQAVRAIGRCAVSLDKAAQRCIAVLLELIQTKVNYVVQEAVIVIKVRSGQAGVVVLQCARKGLAHTAQHHPALLHAH